MTKPTASSRRQRTERNLQEASQEVSSGGDQASIFITRDEMQIMMTTIQEQIRMQGEMMQTLLARNNRPTDGVAQQGAIPNQQTTVNPEEPGLGACLQVLLDLQAEEYQRELLELMQTRTLDREMRNMSPSSHTDSGGNLDLVMESNQ